jgi:hypothetical protein
LRARYRAKDRAQDKAKWHRLLQLSNEFGRPLEA